MKVENVQASLFFNKFCKLNDKMLDSDCDYL